MRRKAVKMNIKGRKIFSFVMALLMAAALLTAPGFTQKAYADRKVTSFSVTGEWYGLDGTGKAAKIHLWRAEGSGDPTDTGIVLTLDGTVDTALTAGTGTFAGVSYGEDTAWHGTFKDLPVVSEDGAAYTYSITEETVSGCYEPVISGNATDGYTVKNISDENRTVRVKKQWADTTEPVTVNLLGDGTQVASVTLDGTADALTTDATGIGCGESSSWQALFTNLPKFDKIDGHRIDYSVTEDEITGVIQTVPNLDEDETTSYDEITIENKRSQKIRPVVTKKWTGVNPEKVTIALQRMQKNYPFRWETVSTVTLDGVEDGDENWSDTTGTATGEYAAWQGRFAEVDKYDDYGYENTYRVVETEPENPSWNIIYAGSLETGFTVANNASTLTSATIAVRKILSGGELTDNEFTFWLYKSDSSWAVGNRLQEKGNNDIGQVSFDPITYETAGTYYYVVKEVIPGDATNPDVNSGSTSYDAATDAEKATAGWTKGDITYDSSTCEVTVWVTGDSTTGLSSRVGYRSASGSSPEYEYFFINTKASDNNTNYTSVDATKVWVPSNPTGKKAYVQLWATTNSAPDPASYGPVVELDGVVDAAPTSYSESGNLLMTYQEDAPWHVTFQKLPRGSSSMSQTVYEVREVDAGGNEVTNPVSGYTSQVAGNSTDGFVITNTKLTSIKFTKNWNDGGGESLGRASITAQLQQYDSATSSWVAVDGVDTITLDGITDSGVTEDGAVLGEYGPWKGLFANLPTYDSEGHVINYRVVETSSNATGYIYVGVTGNMSDGFTLTNTKLTEKNFSKYWVGGTPENGTVTFQLYRSTDGSRYGDENNTAKEWGPSITLDGVVDSAPVADAATGVTTQETTVWHATFSSLPAYDISGNIYTYSVRETASPDGYAAIYANDSGSVMNIKVKEIGVTKEWIGGTPAPVTITLKGIDGGTTYDICSVTLDGTADAAPSNPGSGEYGYEDSAWHVVFKNVPDMDGLTYSLGESMVSGFISIVPEGAIGDTATIKNISTEKTTVQVTKIWKGEPGNVTIALYQDGSRTALKTIALDGTIDENGETIPWVATFGDLPKYDTETGVAHVYTVAETSKPDETGDPVVSDPTAASDALTTYTITNTRSAKIRPTVLKVWGEGINSENKSVTLELQRNRGTAERPEWETVSSVRLDGTPDEGVTANGTEKGEYGEWLGRFDEVEKYDADGDPIDYRVTEVAAGDYNYSVIGNATDGFTVTNTKKAVVGISGVKYLDDQESKTPFTFELYEGTAASGRPLQTVESTDDGRITFDDRIFGDEGTYRFTIHEKDETSEYPNIKFDEADVLVTVEVKKTTSGMSSEITFSKNGEPADEAVFRNYTEKDTDPDEPDPGSPQTGDSSHAVFWVVLMLAAAGSAIGVSRKRKETEQ